MQSIGNPKRRAMIAELGKKPSVKQVSTTAEPTMAPPPVSAGPQYSPELIKALAGNAGMQGPVQHPLEAVARVASAIGAQYMSNQNQQSANAQDQAKREYLMKMLAGTNVPEEVRAGFGAGALDFGDALAMRPKPEPRPQDYTLGTQRFSGATNQPIAMAAPDAPKPDEVRRDVGDEIWTVARDGRGSENLISTAPRWNPTPQTQVNVNNEGNIPPGYQAVRDEQNRIIRLEPIAGSPAAQQQQQQQTQQTQSQTAASRQAQIVVQDIDRAMGALGGMTTGAVGATLGNWPGTAAFDLRQLLRGIQANVTFDKLQQMRAASPTGGALGTVSDTDIQLLQTVMGDLSNSQSAEQLKFNLERLKQQFNTVVHGSPAPGVPRDEIPEGATATNPNTGQKIIRQNGQWAPFNGQ